MGNKTKITSAKRLRLNFLLEETTLISPFVTYPQAIYYHKILYYVKKQNENLPNMSVSRPFQGNNVLAAAQLFFGEFYAAFFHLHTAGKLQKLLLGVDREPAGFC